MPTAAPDVAEQPTNRPGPGDLVFECNVCGTATWFALGRLGREVASCEVCHSTPRWRAIVAVLATELFGVPLPLPEFPVRQDISGIGLSDWPGYAERLTSKVTYENT